MLTIGENSRSEEITWILTTDDPTKSDDELHNNKKEMGIMALRIYRRIEGWKVFLREMKMRNGGLKDAHPIFWHTDGHDWMNDCPHSTFSDHSEMLNGKICVYFSPSRTPSRLFLKMTFVVSCEIPHYGQNTSTVRPHTCPKAIYKKPCLETLSTEWY